jgi:hypothetical protein
VPQLLCGTHILTPLSWFRGQYLSSVASKTRDWSAEEDVELMHLYREHHHHQAQGSKNPWKAIADKLDRTNLGVRSRCIHLQRAFKSLEAQRWTPEEDFILRNGVARFGRNNWKTISNTLLPQHKEDQCRQRWCKQQVFWLSEVSLQDPSIILARIW